MRHSDRSNIGGTTIHSWAGIGLGRADVPKLCGVVRNNPGARGRWETTQVLIIDESAFCFTKPLQQFQCSMRNFWKSSTVLQRS